MKEFHAHNSAEVRLPYEYITKIYYLLILQPLLE